MIFLQYFFFFCEKVVELLEINLTILCHPPTHNWILLKSLALHCFQQFINYSPDFLTPELVPLATSWYCFGKTQPLVLVSPVSGPAAFCSVFSSLMDPRLDFSPAFFFFYLLLGWSGDFQAPYRKNQKLWMYFSRELNSECLWSFW